MGCNLFGPVLFRKSGPKSGRQAATTPIETSAVVQNGGADAVELTIFGWKNTVWCPLVSERRLLAPDEEGSETLQLQKGFWVVLTIERSSYVA